MSNYIKSELFRLRKSKVLWGLLVFTWFDLIMQSINFGKEKEFISFLGDLMFAPYILTVIIGLVVVAGGYKNNAIKNDLTYGISENMIYFSKIIVSIIVGAILIIAADMVVIPISCIINGIENIKDVPYLLQVESVMFVACIASVVCFITAYFIIKKRVISIFVWYLLALYMDTLLGKVGALFDSEVLDKIFNKFALPCVVTDVYAWFDMARIPDVLISSTIMIIACIGCKLIIKKK